MEQIGESKKPFLMQAGEVESKRVFRVQTGWIAALLIVLATAVGGIVISHKSKQEKEAYYAERPVEVNDSVNILGVYTVRTTVEDVVSVTTAEMTMEEDGYILTVYSDYEPHRYNGRMVSDGVFCADELGNGSIMYRPAKNEVTITFTDNNRICELSR